MSLLDTSELEVRRPRHGWEGRLFHSATMTFGYWEVRAGSRVHEHSHPNEEVWHVLDGEFEFTIGGEIGRAGAGCVAVVAAITPHSVTALTGGRAIVVDHPVRLELGGVRID
jgi:quercetin dioxygenase-like cupin family protein